MATHLNQCTKLAPAQCVWDTHCPSPPHFAPQRRRQRWGDWPIEERPNIWPSLWNYHDVVVGQGMKEEQGSHHHSHCRSRATGETLGQSKEAAEKKLTLALVGVLCSSSPPRTIIGIGHASFTIGSSGIVLAETMHGSIVFTFVLVAFHTVQAMTIALASDNWLYTFLKGQSKIRYDKKRLTFHRLWNR